MARAEVILVRPETPANVGAVARVLANSGIDSLTLVSPVDYRTVECWRTAWGAYDILENARVVPELSQAIAEAHYSVALSGKAVAGVPILDVREMASEIAGLPEGTRACLVFGPETSGLRLGELAFCGRIARIPSHPAQPSLNLSHAVMVAAHEVFRARKAPAWTKGLATHGEKDRLLDLLLKGLEAIHALGEKSAERYFQEWRGLIYRADLTPREVRLLEHAARKMIQSERPR